MSEGFHSAGGDLTFGLIKKTWSPRFQKSLGHTLLRAWESPSRSPGYFHQSSGGSVFLFWPICFRCWNDLKLREGRNVCWDERTRFVKREIYGRMYRCLFTCTFIWENLNQDRAGFSMIKSQITVKFTSFIFQFSKVNVSNFSKLIFYISSFHSFVQETYAKQRTLFYQINLWNGDLNENKGA